MSIIVNTATTDLFSTEKDAVAYRDFATDRKTLSFKRSAPKRTKDFPGMEKSEEKLTITDPILGVVGIVTVSTSIRADQLDAVREDIVASATSMTAHVSFQQLVVNQRLPLFG